MVKGVSKNIIEISDTGNDYFERAILFVRPSSQKKDSEVLRRNANDFLSGLKLRPWCMTRGKTLFAAARLLGAAGIGAAVASVLFLR